MFELFTDSARRVVVLAQEEARGLSHDYIGTEHLLLGLIAEGQGAAADMLSELGITLDAVRGQVETIIGRGERQPAYHIPFTPRAKRVIELSAPEAGRYGQHIDTGHILLAIMTEGQGIAAQILTKSGVTEHTIRDRMRERYGVADASDVAGVAARAGVADGAGVAGPLRVPWHEILPVMEAIEERLSAIERHLGIGAPEEPPEDPGGAAD